MGRDTTHDLAAGCVARQDTTWPGRHATRRSTPATRPVLGLRHGTLRATTRRSARMVEEQCVRGQGAVRARPRRSAHSLGAPCAQPWSVGCAPVHLNQF